MNDSDDIHPKWALLMKAALAKRTEATKAAARAHLTQVYLELGCPDAHAESAAELRVRVALRVGSYSKRVPHPPTAEALASETAYEALVDRFVTAEPGAPQEEAFAHLTAYVELFVLRVAAALLSNDETLSKEGQLVRAREVSQTFRPAERDRLPEYKFIKKKARHAANARTTAGEALAALQAERGERAEAALFKHLEKQLRPLCLRASADLKRAKTSPEEHLQEILLSLLEKWRRGDLIDLGFRSLPWYRLTDAGRRLARERAILKQLGDIQRGDVLSSEPEVAFERKTLVLMGIWAVSLLQVFTSGTPRKAQKGGAGEDGEGAPRLQVDPRFHELVAPFAPFAEKLKMYCAVVFRALGLTATQILSLRLYAPGSTDNAVQADVSRWRGGVRERVLGREASLGEQGEEESGLDGLIVPRLPHDLNEVAGATLFLLLQGEQAAFVRSELTLAWSEQELTRFASQLNKLCEDLSDRAIVMLRLASLPDADIATALEIDPAKVERTSKAFENLVQPLAAACS